MSSVANVVHSGRKASIHFLMVRVCVIRNSITYITSMRAFNKGHSRRPQFEVCFLLFKEDRGSINFYVSSLIVSVGVTRYRVFGGNSQCSTSGKKMTQINVGCVSITSRSTFRYTRKYSLQTTRPNSWPRRSKNISGVTRHSIASSSVFRFTAIRYFRNGSTAALRSTINSNCIFRATTKFHSWFGTSHCGSIVQHLKLIPLPDTVRCATAIMSTSGAVKSNCVFHVLRVTWSMKHFGRSDIVPKDISNTVASTSVFTTICIGAIPINVCFRIRGTRVICSYDRRTRVATVRRERIFRYRILTRFRTSNFVTCAKRATFLANRSFTVGRSQSTSNSIFRASSPSG